ncbi:MAG: hypothetical protein IH624_17020 [Phycisphaerae bacterium]|nr:hypothetical protein [Phycisphaerae bacterium]
MNMFHWLWPYWRVSHRLSPFPLPFAPSPTDVREWYLEIDLLATTVNNRLPQDGRLSAGLHRILIETGIAMSAATSSWDPRSWFALYRYGADFAETAPKLSFHAGMQDRDPRVTAISSEEIGAGITCYILREHLGIDHIADAYACIQRGELEYVDTGSRARPDYFCEDANGQIVIAESKGTTGTYRKIRNKVDNEGWTQVQNVRPVNRPLRSDCGRVVIGTRIRVEGIPRDGETTTIIKDPDGEPSREANPESDEPLRLAYAKVLRFAGHDVLAERLLSRRGFGDLMPPIAEVKLPQVLGLPFLGLGLTPFGDAIGFYGPTGKAILGSKDGSIRSLVDRSLTELRSQPRIGTQGYVLPNGVMIVHEPETVLGEL